MFESTLPIGTPDLMRVSAFQRYLQEIDRDTGPVTSRLSSLNPSLVQDLMRFEGPHSSGEGPELLEVAAACLRHGRSVLIHLQSADRVLPLTLFPFARLAHCPVRIEQLLAGRLQDLSVMHVEPAVLGAPGDGTLPLLSEAALYAPLGPVLWQLALRGAREELLPEIAGTAAYRVAPGVDLPALELSGTLATAVARLQRHTTSLREIADWPGFDRGRAMRMLNGLYLQAGLIVTRAHPAATNDGWFSSHR